MPRFFAALCFACLSCSLQAEVPQTVEATWKEFDPRADPLEIEEIRKEITDGVLLRYIRFVVGTFEARKTKAGFINPTHDNGVEPDKAHLTYGDAYTD